MNFAIRGRTFKLLRPTSSVGPDHWSAVYAKRDTGKPAANTAAARILRECPKSIEGILRTCNGMFRALYDLNRPSHAPHRVEFKTLPGTDEVCVVYRTADDVETAPNRWCLLWHVADDSPGRPSTRGLEGPERQGAVPLLDATDGA